MLENFHNHHKPVLLNRVIEILQPTDSKVFFDCTFGSGGHTLELLKNGATVYAIDRDPANIQFADQIKSLYKDKFTFINDTFSNIANIISQCSASRIDGILYDLGVSSMQLDQPERGFSFDKEGPLKMTMGINNITAYDIVNNFDEKRIADILYYNSDEQLSRRIAKAIIIERRNKSINTTLELANIVKKCIPYYTKIHPATRTFQAIRMFVNDELNELKTSLKSAIHATQDQCKICVISFHSKEDKIVKDTFNEYSIDKKIAINRYSSEIFNQREMPKPEVIAKAIHKKPILPDEEIEMNKRARSAKLRSYLILK